MCPAEHSIPGNTTHNNRNMQRVELLVKLLYHLLTCHGQRITWLHESAVLFWLNNESTFFGIKFWHVTQARVIFFSLEVSHSENHRRPFQDQCIYPPLDSCQSMYHTYDIYDFTIKFEDFIEFTTLFEPKKPAVVGFNRPSQAKHLQLPAPSGKTPSPQRSGTSPPSPQQDNKKWQPWTMAKDRHNLC